MKGIESVPLKYFTGGVEHVEGGDKNVAAQNDAGKAPVLQDNAEAEKNKSLAQKLDVLMLRAAKNSTSTFLDKAKVKSNFQKLVDDGVMSKESLKLLANTADKADKAYRALNTLTGKKLASAFKVCEDGQLVLDTETKAGKIVSEAIVSQLELSDLLAQLDKQLGAMERYAQKHPGDRKALVPDETVHSRVTMYRLVCDSRATEINALAHQMHDFALRLAEQGDNADPHLQTILKAGVVDLLPRQALAMHGNVDVVTTLNEGVMNEMRPLAERIDAFRKNPQAKISGEDFLALKSDIARMKAAVVDIAKNGVEVGGSRVIVPRDFTNGLIVALDESSVKLETARHEVAGGICEGIVKNILVLAGNALPLDTEAERTESPNYTAFVAKRDEFFQAAKELAQCIKTGTSTAATRAPLMANVRRLARELQDTAKRAVGDRVPEEAKDSIRRCFDARIFAEQMLAVARELARDDAAFFGSAEAMALFEGKITPSAIVEARVRGLKDGDVDPATDDRNVISTEFLGAGSSGAVHLLKYADGAERIFKGELESRNGLAGLSIGDGEEAYADTQTTVNLNLAARETAEALGCGHLVVKYSAGTHDGEFGFYMERAKGVSGVDLARGVKAAPGSLSGRDVVRLPPEQKVQVEANLMRELNRLQWLDLVTGQSDRHANNYFVHIDSETLNVTVTGIDNDACFMGDRPGANTFRLDANQSAKFEQKIKAAANIIAPSDPARETQRLLDDPGVARWKDKQGRTHYTVNLSKAEHPAVSASIRPVMGVNSAAIPDKIDREMYERLVALKAGPAREEYLRKLADRLDPCSLEAARTRLDDVIAHAERLEKEGKVIDSDKWGGQVEEPVWARWTDADGQRVRVPPAMSVSANRIITPSYFARDGFDKLFR